MLLHVLADANALIIIYIQELQQRNITFILYINIAGGRNRLCAEAFAAAAREGNPKTLDQIEVHSHTFCQLQQLTIITTLRSHQLWQSYNNLCHDDEFRLKY